MGSLQAPPNVETAVYLIETGRKSPAMACKECNAHPYAVADARRRLQPGHVFDQRKGVYVKRNGVWKRTSR